MAKNVQILWRYVYQNNNEIMPRSGLIPPAELQNSFLNTPRMFSSRRLSFTSVGSSATFFMLPTWVTQYSYISASAFVRVACIMYVACNRVKKSKCSHLNNSIESAVTFSRVKRNLVLFFGKFKFTS